MKNPTLAGIAFALAAAIFGVIAFKLIPLLRPSADLTLPAKRCNPSLERCAATLPDGGQIVLSIRPLPIRPLQTLHLDVEVSHLQTEKIEIDFDGTQMRMGYNRPQLTGANGHFRGTTILPVCVTGAMEWVATVLITTRDKRIAAPFIFDVAPR